MKSLQITGTIPKEHRLAGQGAVLFCAFLWSTSGLFIKLVDWHPVVIAGIRSLVAAVFMLALRRFFIVPIEKSKKRRRGPFWAGAFAYAFTMLFFVAANKLTSSANAIMLQYSAPVWAAILGWVFIREKPRREHWAAMVFVAGGFFLFFNFKEGVSPRALLGNCIAILSGIFFGAHSVFLRMQKDGNPADSMLLSHVILFVISIPFIILYPPALSAPPVLAIVFMGTIQIGLASIFFSYGIKRVSAAAAMLTAMIEPVLNPAWVFLVTGEKPSALAFSGGGIIVAAVVFSSVVGKRRGQTPA